MKKFIATQTRGGSWSVYVPPLMYGALDNTAPGVDAEANAQLFAAAPAMVDALRSFPQPGLPGDRLWMEKVVIWYNEIARPVLEETKRWTA